jgi:hypothetical protein
VYFSPDFRRCGHPFNNAAAAPLAAGAAQSRAAAREMTRNVRHLLSKKYMLMNTEYQFKMKSSLTVTTWHSKQSVAIFKPFFSSRS